MDEFGIPTSATESNLRSFLVFNEKKFPSSSLRSMLSALKLLRVLDLGGCKIYDLPTEVGGLIFLRYLNVRKTKIQKLPTSVERLRSLQTLDVRDNDMKSLPAGFVKLKQVRHLLLSKFEGNCMYLEMPGGTGKLDHLQTLSGASLDGSLSRELGHLTQLKKLLLGGVQEQHCGQLCQSISKLQNLCSLKMWSLDEEERLHLQTLTNPPQHLEKLCLAGGMMEFPSWVSSLSSLCVITFIGSQLPNDPLPILGQLPKLVALHLRSAFVGRQIGCSSGTFPKLRNMEIQEMEELEEWKRIEEGSMPHLQYLRINNCPKLNMLPDGLRHLTALKDLSLIDMPEDFLKKLGWGGDDRKNFQSIPINITVLHQVENGTYEQEQKIRSDVVEEDSS